MCRLIKGSGGKVRLECVCMFISAGPVMFNSCSTGLRLLILVQRYLALMFELRGPSKDLSVLGVETFGHSLNYFILWHNHVFPMSSMQPSCKTSMKSSNKIVATA